MIPKGPDLLIRRSKILHLHLFFSVLEYHWFIFALSSSFRSFSISFIPSLKLLTPFPKPFINSGIFLPPQKSKTTRAIIMISPAPIFPKNKIVFIFHFIFKRTQQSHVINWLQTNELLLKSQKRSINIFQSNHHFSLELFTGLNCYLYKKNK